MESFGHNATKIILTNHNFFAESQSMKLNAIKLYVELETTLEQANDYLLAVKISSNFLEILKRQSKKVILFQEVL